MKIIIPEFIKKCIKIINNNGYEAYCVGGAVRDILLGSVPQDFDITTSAPAESLLTMFEKTIPTGLKHGTVTAIMDGNAVEITTYRTESNYSDNRHPEKINFVTNIADDLKRRDFTINALAFNEDNGLLDLFGGIDDLNNKIIRTVGNPNDRFLEDALRILRCFRFSCSLDFKIEENTLNASKKLSNLLKNISAERIFGELKKVFISNNPQKLNELLNTEYFIEFFGKATNISETVRNEKPNFSKRFSLFCVENNIDSFKILTLLKSDNNTKNLCKLYDKALNLTDTDNYIEFKRSINFIPQEKLAEIVSLREKLYGNDNFCIFGNRLLNNKEPYRVDMLNIGGKDIKNLGIDGNNIQITLNKLLDVCINNPTLNDRKILINKVKNF